MYTRIICLLGIFCTLAFGAAAYEPQGTTVKRVGCDVVIVLQIGIESDSEAADVKMIEDALKGCFSFMCDMPCKDILKGNCNIRGEVVVRGWSSLNAADKRSFHRVKMVPGEGTSSVMTKPPNGPSTTAKFYRGETTKEVFCHEAMHLCGLRDRYRDCRGYRVRAGVDNCKDGVPCDTNAEYLTPPCPGWEDDCMGNDVTKPFNCQRNMMEIAKLAGARFTYCTDSCCQEYRTPKNDFDPLGLHGQKPDFGVALDGGFGLYHMANKTVTTDKLNAKGFNFSLSAHYNMALAQYMMLSTFIQFNMLQAGVDRTFTGTGYSSQQHLVYRFLIASLGANLQYQLHKRIAAYAGPEFGYPLGASSKSEGSTTSGLVTTPYSSNGFNKLTADKNIQLGVNVGAITRLMLANLALSPYFNAYIPVTNTLQLPGFRNKIYCFNIGAMLHLGGKK